MYEFNTNMESLLGRSFKTNDWRFCMKTSSTSGVLNNAEGTMNKAASGAHSVVNSIAEAADEMARKASAATGHAAAMVHRAVDKTAGAGDWLAERGETLAAAPKQVFADTRNYVSANPLKALGIAAAVGFLLSHIIRR